MKYTAGYTDLLKKHCMNQHLLNMAWSFVGVLRMATFGIGLGLGISPIRGPHIASEPPTPPPPPPDDDEPTGSEPAEE